MNILITGGASGLGEAITKLLLQNSENRVYFTYNQSKKRAKKIEKEYENSLAIKLNLGNADELEAITKKIQELDIDVLINNAYSGDVTATHFHKIPHETFLNDYKENIIPTIILTQEIIKLFRKKKSGKIITILTSFLSNVPPVGLSSYVANKAYLQKLTKVWASENAKYNISSNSISPSFMQTGLTSDVDERLVEQMILNHPLKKLVTVEEVADTVLFLLNTTNQINGVDIIMNAGVSIN